MTDFLDNTGQRAQTAPCSPKEEVRLTGQKFTKENAEYKKGAPFHRCGLCEYYRGHGCELVAGYVMPMMGCKFFEKG